VSAEPVTRDEATTEAIETPSHSHPLDAISLAFGVIFATIGAVFLSGYDVSDLDGAGFWVALLGAGGVLLLAIGARRQKR
jgi:hypothetical protein